MPTDSPTFSPCLYYRDAPAAIAWLSRAFGFESSLEVPGPDGTIIHAELTFNRGVIMLGTARDDQGLQSPLDLPGVNQMVSVVVDDLDAHYERARAAGAEITVELHDTNFGSRSYSARDPEGHHWCFGTYRPAIG
jgi:uncharacterized glyoxalase superfamily protein PhnB